MTKEVIAAIRGLHFLDEEDGEKLEIITPGEYYFRNGGHYLLFEELDEESGKKTKNTIKFKDGTLELTKKGMVNVHMIFEEQKKNMTSYVTPFGNILIGIDASTVSCEEQEGKLCFLVDYALDVNYERMADCKIQIEICPREEGSQLFTDE